MKRTCMVAALTLGLFGVACGGNNPNEEATRANAPAGEDDSKQLAFTDADLDKLERGLRREVDAAQRVHVSVRLLQALHGDRVIAHGGEASEWGAGEWFG